MVILVVVLVAGVLVVTIIVIQRIHNDRLKHFEVTAGSLHLFPPALKSLYLEEQLQKLLVQQIPVLQNMHNGDTLSKQ
jgi:hypothetical protein